MAGDPFSLLDRLAQFTLALVVALQFVRLGVVLWRAFRASTVKEMMAGDVAK